MPIRSVILVGLVLTTLGAAMGCSSSSPTAPTPAVTSVAGVALNAASVSAGVAVQGTVTLTAAAPAGGLTVALTSSNPAVATVPTSVSVVSGASSASISITTVAQGSATITAALNGTSKQSPTLTVTAGAVLQSLSLSASTIVGGNSVTGTVALSAIAPANGAVVSLSGADPVTVPTSVTVPSGSLTATFTINTRAVGGTLPATITASYSGAMVSATLSVTRATQATANFGVSGPTETETCTLTNGGNTLNCTFNGSTSTAPGNITAWDWTFGVSKIYAQTTTGPVLTMPAVDCSIVPSPPFPQGVTWFTMTVTLKVHDDQGNVSALAVDNGVRLFPQGVCGF